MNRACSLISVAAALALAACNPGSLAEPAAAECVEAGTQCQLPEGPLGVCERSTCAASAKSPCFQCVGQH